VRRYVGLGVVLLLVLSGLLFVPPASASSTSEVLLPTADDGGGDNWQDNFQGCSTDGIRFDEVDEGPTSDENTSCLGETSSFAIQMFAGSGLIVAATSLKRAKLFGAILFVVGLGLLGLVYVAILV
jgi:hypothetical protein